MTTIVPSSSITAGGCEGYEYILNTFVTGSGSITCTPSRPLYHHLDDITISATPADPDWFFDSWTGPFTSVVNPTSFQIDDNPTDLTAHFYVVSFKTFWDWLTDLEDWYREDSYGTGMSVTAPGDSLLHIINTGGGWQLARADYSFNYGSQRYMVYHDLGALVSGVFNNPSNNFPGVGYSYSGVAYSYQWTPPYMAFLPNDQAGNVLTLISIRSQMFGLGNDFYCDNIMISGIYRGDLWEATGKLRWWPSQYNYTIQIPNAYGFGKLNYIKVYSHAGTFDPQATYMVGGGGYGVGQLKVGMTVVTSTVSGGLPTFRLWSWGSHSLTNSMATIYCPVGHRVILSGTTSRTWYDDGGFGVHSGEIKTGDIHTVWIDKVWWTDGTGDHTIVDYGSCPY